jgi:hypothetical protein
VETGEIEGRRKKKLLGRGKDGKERGRTKGKQERLERMRREECCCKGKEEVKCKEKRNRLMRWNREGK